MKHRALFVTFFVAFVFTALPALAGHELTEADQAAIRDTVETLERGWNTKDGGHFASAFAPEHDYVVIDGRFLPGLTPERNAQAHQAIFDTVFREVDIDLEVAKVRPLAPGLALAHVKGFSYGKGNKQDRRTEVIISVILEDTNGRWQILAFQNTPVEAPEEGVR